MDRPGSEAMRAASAPLTADARGAGSVLARDIGPDAVAETRKSPIYAALDLGTNNCRLLIARQPDAGAADGDFPILDR